MYVKAFRGKLKSMVSLARIICVYCAQAKQNHTPNEFVLLQDKDDPKRTALARYNKELGILMPLIYGKADAMAIRPRNKEQAMAMELLLNDDVKLITLLGPAGTGKTLLAIAAGLYKVVRDKSYMRLLISRPVMPLGKDIGFLPGTKEEKLENWMIDQGDVHYSGSFFNSLPD